MKVKAADLPPKKSTPRIKRMGEEMKSRPSRVTEIDISDSEITRIMAEQCEDECDLVKDAQVA